MAIETLVAEMKAKVRALDESIETRVATLNTTRNGVDILPQPRRSHGHSLSALGVLAVLVIVNVAVMRSPGGADQTSTPAPAPEPRPPASPANAPSPPQRAALLNNERPPANREQPLPKRQLRTIEQRPEVFLGTLAVRSDPSGAAVFLNGRAVGTTPLQLQGVRAGSSALRIEHQGYQRWTASIHVPADKRTNVDAKLEVEELRSR